jgi:hypothetical protein
MIVDGTLRIRNPFDAGTSRAFGGRRQFDAAGQRSRQGRVGGHLRNRPDVSDRLIAEVNKRAGCEATLTFDEVASRTPGFRLLQSSG